jgi:hypothetical protein
VLFAVYPYENFIDVKSVAIASVFSFQSSRLYSSEFDAPKAYRFTADSDSSFGKEVFNIAMAQVETIVEPDSVRNDVWRESVSFISIHPPILSAMEI